MNPKDSDSYRQINGIIQNPGKFEGEPAYVVDLWFDADVTFYDNDRPIFVVVVDEDLRRQYPALLSSEDECIVLWEDDNGFVHSRIMSANGAENWQQDCETRADDERENDNL